MSKNTSIDIIGLPAAFVCRQISKLRYRFVSAAANSGEKTLEIDLKMEKKFNPSKVNSDLY